MPVLDAKGHRITYDRKTLDAMTQRKAVAKTKNRKTTAHAGFVTQSHGFVPTGGQTEQPFWQYAIFGSGIGASNIIVGPTPQNGAPEVIIGGNSRNDFGGDDFWQVIRHNPATGGYDTTYVSRLYCEQDDCTLYHGSIQRIGLAHVSSVSDQQIVVMLYDGRIYLYDFATKSEIGYLDTGVGGLYGLSLTDLDGDGLAELIVTTSDDLFVFSGSGQLLWQVPGAGGYDVVAGRMDNGASLRIAATNGKVVDAATHDIVWTYSNGFGNSLKLAPFAGENYEQLIATSSWEFVYSYDVGRQLPRWSIDVGNDYIGAIDVADLDGDSIPEVVVGEGQSGNVHVYDLNTQAENWTAHAGYSGVNSIAAGDVDGDGTAELLWAAGYGDTGPDYLYVTRTTPPHDIKWQSLDLQGPFLGPVIGDLDGDGQPELVICAPSSDSGYSGGRILVFDLATLTLRGISAPVTSFGFGEGVHDFKLRDIDQDGRLKILIASGDYSSGLEVYQFNFNNTFIRTWPSGMLSNGSFNFVDAADLDGNDSRKLLASSYDGYVYAFDYPIESNPWRSIQLGGSVTGFLVADLDGNSSTEIAALVDNGDLYTWDGPTRQLRNLRQGTGGTLLSDGKTSAGLVLGDANGVGHFLQYANNSYTESFMRQLATNCDPYGFTPCFNGINAMPNGSVWIGDANNLTERVGPSFDNDIWQSPAVGASFGRFVATDFRNNENRVFSSAQHAVVGLTHTGPTPAPTPAPNVRASYDFNEDGRADFLLYNSSTRRTAIWYMNNNVYTSGSFGPVLAGGWNIVDAVDFNRDRNPDFVLFNAGTHRTAIWYLNNNIYTGGTYGPTLPAGWQLAAVGDFNHDHNPDYVLFNPSTHRTAIWYMNNNLYTGSAFGPSIGNGWQLASVGDFNRDGNTDYLLFNATTHQSAMWYLNDLVFVSAAYAPIIPSGYVLTGTADFDRDGKRDYALFNPSTRRSAIWYLDNNHFLRGAYGPISTVSWMVIRP